MSAADPRSGGLGSAAAVVPVAENPAENVVPHDENRAVAEIHKTAARTVNQERLLRSVTRLKEGWSPGARGRLDG